MSSSDFTARPVQLFLGALLAATGLACGVSTPLPTDLDGGAPDASDEVKDAGREAPEDAGATTTGSADASSETPRPCGTGPGCDPTDLGGETCESLGLGAGRLVCDPATCTFVVGLCTGLPRDASTGRPCGTGPGCNPDDLGGQSCETLGMPAGFLDCDPETCTFDTSLCGGGALGGAGLGGLFGGGAATDAGTTGTFGGGFFGGGATDGGTTGAFGGGFFGGAGGDGGAGFFGGGGSTTVDAGPSGDDDAG